jgi:beta-lactamase regulating signal transducer with metallopeptidase domain
MPILKALLLDPKTVIYLFNLAIAAIFVCGLGLLAARACRRRPAPVRHGILVGTLAIVLLSPCAVWVGQRTGLTWVQVAVSDRADSARNADRAPIKPLPGRVSVERSPSVSMGIAQPSATTPAHIPSAVGSVSAPPWKPSLAADVPSEGVSDEEHSSFARTAAWLSVVCSWQLAGTMLAYVWLAGFFVHAIGLAWGFRILAGFRRCLEEVAEPRMRALARHAAEAVGRRDIPRIFRSPFAPAPFCLGIVRPMIVLPDVILGELDDGQLQAILIHETAHLARRDTWVSLAQRIAVLLFWWNVLVYRLRDRIADLREDICDNYVCRSQRETARFAEALVWLAARATTQRFLPATLGILEPAGLVGRITRLLNKERNMATRMNPVSKALVLTWTGAVLLAIVLAGGLRAAHSAAAAAEGTNVEKAAADVSAPVGTASVPAGDHAKLGKFNDSIDTTFLTANASSILILRPAAAFARPEFAPLAKFLEKSGRMVPPGTRLSDFRQITIIEPWLAVHHNSTGPVVMIFQWIEPVAEKYLMAHGTDKEYPIKEYHGKKLYSRFDRDWLYFLYDQPLIALQYDDHTVIATQTEELLSDYLTGKRGVRPGWLHWEPFSNDHFVFAAERDMLRRTMREIAERSPQVVQDAFLPVSSLWEDPAWCATGARLDGRFTAHACLGGTNPNPMMKVWGMAEALRTVAQNAVKKTRSSVEADRPPDLATARAYLDLADSLLSNMKSEYKTTFNVEVWLESYVELDSARLRNLSVPSDVTGRIGALARELFGAADGAMVGRSPSQALRKEADKARSQNNLKILAQAMRKYHDDKGHFPPAVLYGPDGKTPYSWRVAILPYMEYSFLQSMYHFDELWDGPHNRLFATTSLPEFRRPNELGYSPNTAYFALVGPGTIFDSKKGTNSKDITDGTANTILLVEAKRNIPWAKPEDIAYDPDKPLPELGGYSEDGFNVALADGTVQFLPRNVGEKILRALITKAGGEPVKIEDALPARR